MELTQAINYQDKAKATWISICTFLRLYILGFISRNAPVFEGLTRAGAPFGGNCLPRTKNHILQKNGHLPDATVGRSGTIDLLDRPIDHTPVSGKKPEIGIHRHRSSPVLRNFGE